MCFQYITVIPVQSGQHGISRVWADPGYHHLLLFVPRWLRNPECQHHLLIMGFLSHVNHSSSNVPSHLPCNPRPLLPKQRKWNSSLFYSLGGSDSGQLPSGRSTLLCHIQAVSSGNDQDVLNTRSLAWNEAALCFQGDCHLWPANFDGLVELDMQKPTLSTCHGPLFLAKSTLSCFQSIDCSCRLGIKNVNLISLNENSLINLGVRTFQYTEHIVHVIVRLRLFLFTWLFETNTCPDTGLRWRSLRHSHYVPRSFSVIGNISDT